MKKKKRKERDEEGGKTGIKMVREGCSDKGTLEQRPKWGDR